MKKIILIICSILFQVGFAQVGFEKNKLTKDGKTYKVKDYELVFENKEALGYFKKAKTNNSISNVIGTVGGGFLGYGLARALSGKNNKTIYDQFGNKVEVETKGWGAVGIGVGLIGVAVPFVIASNKNAKKAIAIENGESTAFKPYFKLENSGNGLALSYNF